ncbi:chitobiosyldiphosphodolichol beta-mannosyltransferase [Atheta coriaria]|uniref:chitobiosyldiphosphodolichol beta-mannosyltransferase n=1 Tax=Dalotia coriaria TaxID=877792 RepID=UPI0031F478BE
MSKNVCVVVLGDIGRSPRMQYHSISLAESGHKVDIVGYRGAAPVEKLTSQPHVSFHYMIEWPNLPLPRFLNYILKTVWQMISLLFVFLIIRKADFILVQNPPAVPSLCACFIYKIFSHAKLVIDWHNYAHTIMALAVGPKSILVRMTKAMEKFFGQCADYNMCVTNEMKLDLEGSWGIKACTLYDRPLDIFKPITLEEKHQLFIKLKKDYPELSFDGQLETETLVSAELDSNQIVDRLNRPAILVSSTSWTEDEDFKVLMEALQAYEKHWEAGNTKNLPKLVCIITGNGPMKQFYKNLIHESNWKHIKVITPWLEAADYPKMLASADLGVSLHTSSSGLDLPMKVVDMFGCELPVCAYNFKCLHELVEHDANSYVFNSVEELSEQLQTWFKDFPNNPEQKSKQELFKKSLKQFRSIQWSENWQSIASPIFT